MKDQVANLDKQFNILRNVIMEFTWKFNADKNKLINYFYTLEQKTSRMHQLINQLPESVEKTELLSILEGL